MSTLAYVPMEVVQHKVTSTEASAGAVELTMPTTITGVIANVYSSAGIIKSEGVKVVVSNRATKHTVKISSENLSANDNIMLIAV